MTYNIHKAIAIDEEKVNTARPIGVLLDLMTCVDEYIEERCVYETGTSTDIHAMLKRVIACVPKEIKVDNVIVHILYRLIVNRANKHGCTVGDTYINGLNHN